MLPPFGSSVFRVLSFAALLMLSDDAIGQQQSTSPANTQSTPSSAEAQESADKLIRKMVTEVATTEPNPSSYAITGTELLGGPGADDVAAHMALMAFGTPVKKVMDRFGGLNATSTSNDVTIITHMASITTSLALLFTSFMLIGALLGGVIYTGKDGELLGKDWDNKLFPLRATWHTGFLVPWPGFGGLCGIQVFIVFLGLIGLGIGGVAFKSGVKFIASGNQIVTYQSRDINGLAEELMHAAMCDAVNQRVTTRYTPSIRIEDAYDTIQTAHANPIGGGMVRYKVGKKLLVGTNGECGKYVINYLPPNLVDADLKAARAEFKADDLHSDIIKTALFEHLTGTSMIDFFNEVSAIISTTGGFADRVAYDQEGPNNDLQQLTDTEIQALETAREKFYIGVVNSFTPSVNTDVADDLATLNASFIDEISRFGFAFFFKYYYELSSRQEVTSNAVASLINVNNSFSVPWNVDYCTGLIGYLWCNEEEAAMAKKKRISRAFKDMYDKTNVLYSNALGAMVDDQTYSGSIIENYTFKIVQTLTEVPRDVNPDPILEIKWLGDTMTAIADAVFIFSAKVKAVSDGAATAVSQVPILNGLFEGAKSLATSLISKLWVGLLPLFGLAFAYAYIIPSIPVIFGFVAVFSYFIYWSLAIYHAPFWYAMGVMPKGDGLMGRANTGYTMAVNLLLMPAFMIIGYFTGMSLMKVFGWMVSISFFDAMADVNRAGGVNDFSLSKFVGLLVVYGTIYTVLIWKCFGMIFEASNELSKWMGTSNRTDFGEGEAKQTAMASSAVAGQKFGESVVHMKRDNDKDDRDKREEDKNDSVNTGSDDKKRKATAITEEIAKKGS